MIAGAERTIAGAELSIGGGGRGGHPKSIQIDTNGRVIGEGGAEAEAGGGFNGLSAGDGGIGGVPRRQDGDHFDGLSTRNFDCVGGGADGDGGVGGSCSSLYTNTQERESRRPDGTHTGTA